MRISIIPSDGTVVIDKIAYIGIDLSKCGIPEDIHALQWYESWGEVEYVDKANANLRIETLPEWATACATAWESADLKAKIPPEPEPLSAEALARIESDKALRQSGSDKLLALGLTLEELVALGIAP